MSHEAYRALISNIIRNTLGDFMWKCRWKFGSKNAAFLDNGVLRVDLDGNTHRLIEEGDLQIKGEHNVSNALAAASAVLGLVDNVDGVREGLISFAPLEHRIEPCGSVMGVACYNDSKATNVDATLKALAAFGNKRPLVLLGGDDKGTDLSELVAEAEAHTKGVVCFGEAGGCVGGISSG